MYVLLWHARPKKNVLQIGITFKNNWKKLSLRNWSVKNWSLNWSRNWLINWSRTYSEIDQEPKLDLNKRTAKSKYIWVLKYFKLNILKFSVGKRLFRSSGYVILLYGQSCSSFNRIVLWTVKNKNVFLLIHSFLYLLERPP